MTRGIQELDAMSGVVQEFHATVDGLQNAANTFLPEILIDTTANRNVTNTTFAAVCVQVVRDQSVASLWIKLDQVVDILKVVFLGSTLTNHRSEDPACRYMQVSK